MSDDTCDSEIERRVAADGRLEYRVTCSCGFVGPWRLARSSARRDRDNHEDRRACGEA
jgi:hypothetical protein